MKSLKALKTLLAKRAAVGKQILAAEKKLVEAAEALEKTDAKPAKKPAKPRAKKSAPKKLVQA